MGYEHSNCYMATQQEVQVFLQDFKAKLGVWGVIFRSDRGKNTQALLDLDITSITREAIIKELGLADFSEGPLPDHLNGGADMWVFGKTVKNVEVYIKITIGTNSKPVICISFHPSTYPMNYPYKKTES